MSHICFIHSCAKGHLGCYHILVIVNNAATNIGVIIVSPTFERQFTGYRSLGWQGIFFSFSILNISVHCLLTYKVSDEKFADSLIEDPLYVTSCFLLPSELSFSLFSDSLTVACLCVGLFEFILLRVCWVSSMFVFIFFIKIGKFSSLFFQIS